MVDKTTATSEEPPATINKYHGHDWLPLFALASHAAGDFPLQTNDMAARKFDSRFVGPPTSPSTSLRSSRW